MDINQIRRERLRWLEWKNIAPLREKLKNLPDIKGVEIKLEDSIKIEGDIKEDDFEKIKDAALAMRPWRKGPFDVFGLFIDSEWRSYIKYNLLKPHFDLGNKKVADIGCNNGYYMFRMLKEKPKKIVGFDPSALFKTQFDFINRFVKSDIVFEMLGVEHLPFYEEKFDIVFCLGVLYHRSDPIATLKALKRGLNPKGELFLDTFFIESNEEIALVPRERYSKIPNVYFIPSIKALANWCERAGFKDFEVLEKRVTDESEQRRTDWIYGESLENFLDPNDKSKTVEGYPAPKRVYIKAVL